MSKDSQPTVFSETAFKRAKELSNFCEVHTSVTWGLDGKTLQGDSLVTVRGINLPTSNPYESNVNCKLNVEYLLNNEIRSKISQALRTFTGEQRYIFGVSEEELRTSSITKVTLYNQLLVEVWGEAYKQLLAFLKTTSIGKFTEMFNFVAPLIRQLEIHGSSVNIVYSIDLESRGKPLTVMTARKGDRVEWKTTLQQSKGIEEIVLRAFAGVMAEYYHKGDM